MTFVTSTSTGWEATAAAKRAARDALIPSEWLLPDPSQYDSQLNVVDVPRTSGILSPFEVEITDSPAETILEQLREQAWTSVDVTRAFCKRAAIAQQLTNCLTEILFEQALVRAKQLDDILASTGKVVGPLHGLPVSLKDNFNIQSVDSTVGFVAWANSPAEAAQESVMTQIMVAQGAVLFCKTNVPTAMMMAESYNNVWGYTSNPYNRNASSGGSSGGESALLAMRGSPIGVGTDIGGSIRIPSSFCGLYSLKPSFGRFGTYGARSGMPGQEAVRSINGPMSTSLLGVELWSRAVLDAQPWLRDPNMLPLGYREEDTKVPERLYIGIITDNGVVRPTPPVQRALAVTKKALEEAGHVVVEWQPSVASQIDAMLKSFFLADGGEHIAEAIQASGEPWPKGMVAYKEAWEKAEKEGKPTVSDLWKLQVERTALAKKALDEWQGSSQWAPEVERPFDAVISPVTPWAASLKGKFGPHVGYTAIWNILDQPAVTFPVTTVDTALDAKTPDFAPRNAVEEAVWQDYDVAASEHLPVALQCVGPRLREERVIAIVKAIEQLL